MAQKFANNATSTLAADLAAAGLSLTIQSGDASKFPTLGGADWHKATLVNASGDMEIIKVTARTGAALTIVRAQEGTTALDWVTGDRIDVRLTADALDKLVDDAAFADRVHGAASATTLADADEFGFWQNAATTWKKITTANLIEYIRTKLGAMISGSGAKTTLVDADQFAISDSAASNGPAKHSWLNLKAGIWTALGALINGGTALTALVDNDAFAVWDSTNSVTKKVLWSKIKAGLPPGAGLGTLINGQIVTSTTGGKRTFAVKTLAGADPSPADPVYVAFRNATAATGDYTLATITAALSVDMSNGSTGGLISASPGRIWVVIFNDAGTIRLGWINCLKSNTDTSIYPLRDDTLESSTAEGGAGAADSSQVIYTGTAVTAKPMRIVGYVDVTETTAGTNAATPTKVQQFGPGVAMPGERVGGVRIDTGAYSSGGQIPVDDTVPQSSEGFLLMSTPSYSPRAAANILHITSVSMQTSNSGQGAWVVAALFRDSATSAVASQTNYGTNGVAASVPLNYREKAGSTTATQYKVRGGGNTGSTYYFNGTTAARIFNGTCNSFTEVEEIQA